jgi:hypothetical protein
MANMAITFRDERVIAKCEITHTLLTTLTLLYFFSQPQLKCIMVGVKSEVGTAFTYEAHELTHRFCCGVHVSQSLMLCIMFSLPCLPFVLFLLASVLSVFN